MSVDRFRFVSPGVFINEIDQSQIPRAFVPATGPAIIGRTEKGPALRAVTVRNFAEFVSIFGAPMPGGRGGDVWRDGNYSAPTYAAYAAQAYLANQSPINFVRLLGDQHPAATGTDLAGWLEPAGTSASAGGVYGLFIVKNPGQVEQLGAGPGVSSVYHTSGTLAAVFYASALAVPALSGAVLGGGDSGSPRSRTSQYREPVSVQGANEFKITVFSGSSVANLAAVDPNIEDESSFNFEPTSGRYIRKVFNTNPQLTNATITPATALKGYWLGESFDRNVADFLGSRTNFSSCTAVMLKMGDGTNVPGNFQRAYATPSTPPIVAQSLSTNFSGYDVNEQQELFTVGALNDAEWPQNNIKISFRDIKQSPSPNTNAFGTFTLLVRDMADTDENPVVLEQFDDLNLNPNSREYIARRIGDQQLRYDAANSKYRIEGEWPNLSRYIRVDMNSAVHAGATDQSLLPFGFKGVPMYVGFNVVSASAWTNDNGDQRLIPTTLNKYSQTAISGAGTLTQGTPNTIFNLCSSSQGTNVLAMTPSFPGGHAYDVDYGSAIDYRGSGSIGFGTASFQFPFMPQRVSSSDGTLLKQSDAYWGLSTVQSPSSLQFDASIRDILRRRPANLDTDENEVQRGPGFSLDNLVYSSNSETAFNSGSVRLYGPGRDFGNYLQGVTQGGARKMGTSMTAQSSSYVEVLDMKFSRFTVPMFGGFDGWDITEKEPLNNTRALESGGVPKTNAKTSWAYYTVKKAMDTIADPDFTDINLATVPGLWARNVTDYLLQVCETRADAMAVIDLEGGYTSSAENLDSFADRRGDVSASVRDIKARSLNTSYGAAYYPWVQIRDGATGVQLWAPPSVVALGTYASSELRSELWFAPAGFNRGGLSQGAAGVPVVGVVERLTSTDRDALYEVNINPIASFPAEGIVVFGQKTLQATQSALDRVNVRRLMIYLKKQISRISANILFDPNIQVTWDRFVGRVEPLLRSVRSRYGLSDYRVILDSTTTTPELVDRNIMYAKIFLKPTRAIEFIALDFIITRTGASFDD